MKAVAKLGLVRRGDDRKQKKHLGGETSLHRWQVEQSRLRLISDGLVVASSYTYRTQVL